MIEKSLCEFLKLSGGRVAVLSLGIKGPLELNSLFIVRTSLTDMSFMYAYIPTHVVMEKFSANR